MIHLKLFLCYNIWPVHDKSIQKHIKHKEDQKLLSFASEVWAKKLGNLETLWVLSGPRMDKPEGGTGGWVASAGFGDLGVLLAGQCP